jgi:hypothetical protein
MGKFLCVLLSLENLELCLVAILVPFKIRDQPHPTVSLRHPQIIESQFNARTTKALQVLTENMDQIQEAVCDEEKRRTPTKKTSTFTLQNLTRKFLCAIHLG